MLCLHSHPIDLTYTMQKENVLWFRECVTCLWLYNKLHDYILTVPYVVRDKENDRGWFHYYDRYLDCIYKLDYHMNKRHRKVRIKKESYGHLYRIGEVVLLEELSDRSSDQLTPLVVWDCDYNPIN